MTSETTDKKSHLITALREAVGIVQMVLYKEVRILLSRKKSAMDPARLAGLAGAITNEVFGTQNPEDRFVRFRAENWGEIEQELLALKEELPDLCAEITDALRIQTLCDHQEGNDTSQILVHAKEYGFLLEEREIPLPSFFMTLVRALGEKHNLIIAPAQMTPLQETPMVH